MPEDNTTGSSRDEADTRPRAQEICDLVASRPLSGNTGRALRSDLAIYTAWCAESGCEPLPATAETVAEFIDGMAAVRSPATVRRYLASINAAHRAAGGTDISGSEPVRAALGRMHRRKGRRQAQAQGLTWELRERLLEATGDRLIDLRDRALLAVAYDTLMRRSELVAVRVSDIVDYGDGSASVLVRTSKTDPEGFGARAYVARDTMSLVRNWLRQAGVIEGRLFRSLCRGELGEGLGAGHVSRIFKRMARTAGLPDGTVAAISGHSARVGAAQDMVEGGIGMAAILHSGRWKSPDMVNRYGEHLLARRSGAAMLARRQGRE
ncbi:MAG: tyrosine-type recombinase/integrase [Boseongicola sp. SB0667_bin_21]|nr:tyrosine-type recombinase/integrase [Boseongicola sp. SB0667_bin_21]